MDTKPGYKTTEFWLTLIGTCFGLLLSKDFISEDKISGIIGYVNIVLLPLGYTIGRSIVKSKSQLNTK